MCVSRECVCVSVSSVFEVSVCVCVSVSSVCEMSVRSVSSV